jgi:hypothetical protein
MGFWEGVKKFGEKVGSEINSYIDDVKRKNARWDKYKQLKLRIVGNASLSELKSICKEYGIPEPNLYYVDPFDGKKESLGDPRKLFLNQIIRKMSLDKLIDYGKKKRIPMNDIINEKRKADEEFSKGSVKPEKEKDFESEMAKEEESEDEFELILKGINEFDPETIRDEKDLENMLKTWLRAKFNNSDIKTQYKTDRGDVDIVINDKYGIELKLVERTKTLEDLQGQVLKYIRTLGKNNLAVVLLVNEYIKQEDLDFWTKNYEDLGARVLILEKGRIKRNKPLIKKATISWRR